MLPITELRGAIPLAITQFSLPLLPVLLISILGNLIPAFILLWGLEKLVDWIDRRSEIGHNILKCVFRHTRRRTRIVERYGWIGLMLFVALPLPGSGVWTGSIGAFLLGINKKIAFGAIFAGVLIAGIVVSLTTKAVVVLL